MTFAITGETLVTAIDFKPKKTTALQRLRNLRANPTVSIVIDEYDEDWSALWWVRIDGPAHVVEAGPDHERTIAALVAKYAQYREQVPTGPAIIVRPNRWTAWAADAATFEECAPAETDQ